MLVTLLTFIFLYGFKKLILYIINKYKPTINNSKLEFIIDLILAIL